MDDHILGINIRTVKKSKRTRILLKNFFKALAIIRISINSHQIYKINFIESLSAIRQSCGAANILFADPYLQRG
jgi:hypothetical protein